MASVANPVMKDSTKPEFKLGFNWRNFLFCCFKSDNWETADDDSGQKKDVCTQQTVRRQDLDIQRENNEPLKVEYQGDVEQITVLDSSVAKSDDIINEADRIDTVDVRDVFMVNVDADEDEQSDPDQDENGNKISEADDEGSDPEENDGPNEIPGEEPFQPSEGGHAHSNTPPFESEECLNSVHMIPPAYGQEMSHPSTAFSIPESSSIPMETYCNLPNEEINEDSNIKGAEKRRIGDIRVKLVFEPEKSCLFLTVVEAHDFARPCSSTNSIREMSAMDVPAVLAYSVHILVVQVRKLRFKTKMRQGPDPYFDEIIKIPKTRLEEAEKWCLRFRLYGSMRNSIQKVIGEGYLRLQKLNLESPIQCDLALFSQCSNICEEEMDTLFSASQNKFGSLHSLISADSLSNFLDSGMTPELLVGLSFNFSTGRLNIEVKRGNKIPKLKDNKVPDSFIKILLIDSKGEEMFTAKTSVKKSSCEPAYEESFIFEIMTFELDNVTLKIQGYHKLKLGKKYLFGTILLGSKSQHEEGLNHWRDVLATKLGEEIIRWHPFDTNNL